MSLWSKIKFQFSDPELHNAFHKYKTEIGAFSGLAIASIVILTYNQYIGTTDNRTNSIRYLLSLQQIEVKDDKLALKNLQDTFNEGTASYKLLAGSKILEIQKNNANNAEENEKLLSIIRKTSDNNIFKSVLSASDKKTSEKSFNTLRSKKFIKTSEFLSQE